MQLIKQLLSDMRSSFWFLPSLVVAGSIALAVALIDAHSLVGDRWLAEWPRLFGSGPEGARQLLSTLAGSMMTVMGITFSMTLVALALTSSQYTSRILHDFMRNRVTQATLGMFAGIFTYCLIVLRTIRGGTGGAEFVPSVAVLFALVLALGGVVVLIYFIHHIASSIQASSIIASVAEKTLAAIDRMFPDNLGYESDEDEDEVLPFLAEKTWHVVPAMTHGYIQSLDFDELLRLARNKETIVRMKRGVGAFLVRDSALALLALEEPPDQQTIAAVNASYRVSSYRTVDQDPAFGIRQIVDMALKALSPGVNDVSTAVMCVDYLTVILARLASCKFPAARHHEEGELRVIATAQTFGELLADAFDQIRRSAAGNVSVMSRMLGALEAIASLTNSTHRRRQLFEQVQRIAELAERTIDATHDRTRIERRLAHAREAIEVGPASCAQESESVSS